MRSYDPADLLPIDPTILRCARAWVRLWLKALPDTQDKYPEHDLQDAEYNAALTLDSVSDSLHTYYRPAITAARLYEGDPLLLRSEGAEGWSNSRRSTPEIIAAWLAQGQAFDRLIPPALLYTGETGGRPVSYLPRAVRRRTVL